MKFDSMTKYTAVILESASGDHPSCNYDLENSETNNPIKAIHKFHVPQSQGLGGIPKSKIGAQPFANQTSKYDPSSWEEFYDSKEILDGKIPVYYAGS